MTRRAYLYFVVTFVLGIIVGCAGLFSYAWYWGHWHRSFDKQHIVRHLKLELNLSDAQVQQLTPIVSDWADKQSDLRSRIDPQFQALREDFHNRVRKILNEEQVVKFDNLVKRHEERMRKARRP